MKLRVLTGGESWEEEAPDEYKISDGCLLLFRRTGKATRYDDGLRLIKAYAVNGWQMLEIAGHES